MVAIVSNEAEVRRLLDRYLVEVVETYGLCPWAKSARTSGEVSVKILWGVRPSVDEWVAAANDLMAIPTTRVAMILAPELSLTMTEFHVEREQVGRRVETCGVADFHPDGELDTGTPSRLVSFLRRSPDPLMQFVPLKILDAIRAQTSMHVLSEQARALGGIAFNDPDDIGDEIAATNHKRALADGTEIKRILDDIAADRRRSYPRAGIAINTSR